MTMAKFSIPYTRTTLEAQQVSLQHKTYRKHGERQGRVVFREQWVLLQDMLTLSLRT